MTRAVVFAYHNVGVRSLKVVLDAGIDVRLVVTHEDNPSETIWFQSVAGVAAEHGLHCIAPDDANTPEVLDACRAAAPDFLFSFYYRQMLKAPLLEIPSRGAFNLHGSLLPKYRGRAPVNWAVLKGERETGATLHAMEIKPDRGSIVDQQAVPILQDDTAREVFDKVTVAAEIVMARALPTLIDGTAVMTPQDLSQGAYFGGRRPEDGRLPPMATARELHDLVRAVAPPDYPGAFFDHRGQRIVIGRTRLDPCSGPIGTSTSPSMFVRDDVLCLRAADGGTLRVIACTVDGRPLGAAGFIQRFGSEPIAPDH